MLSAIPSFSQERGFFRVYERDDKSFGPSCAIELSDGSFIVAANDRSVYNEAWNLEISGELVKLSSEGELLRSVPIADENGHFQIENIFQHPSEPGMFIGTGMLYDPEGLPGDYYHTVPYLIQFDEELHITLQTSLCWPDEYQSPWVGNSRTMLDRLGKLFSVFLCRYETNGLPQMHRLYAQISTEGEIEHIVKDTVDLHPQGCSTEAVFEFPDTRQKGLLRQSFVVPGNGTTTPRLYRLNKIMEAEEVNEIHRFANDTTIYQNSLGQPVIDIQCIYLNDYVKTTVLPLDDSTLLFALIGDEYLHEWTPDTNIFLLESSAVMFKTDTEGNIQQQYFVEGSWNDTIESIPARSFDVTDEDAFGHKYIYHCCETEEFTTPYDGPNVMTITKMTEDFEIVWQKKYAQPGIYMQPRHLVATADGGCLVVGVVNRSGQPLGGHHEIFALKLLPDGTVGTGEITVTDEIFFYPNPARDVLYLHYPQEMQPTQLALYDLQGRLVHSQTTGFESLSMAGLAAGQYVLKVALENGKTYTDKVIKE